jgi:Protein of unknown function (DUF2752)
VTGLSWRDTAQQGDQHSAHRHRVSTAVGAGVLLGGAVGYVGLVNPHDPHSVYPQCPFKWATGWNCPFCGGLRMTHDLLHGDLMATINDNLFLLVGLPALAGWLLLRWRRGQRLLPMPAVVTIAVATFAWTVLRNLPGFPLIPTVLSG